MSSLNISDEKLKEIRKELPARWPYDYFEVLYFDPEKLSPLGRIEGIKQCDLFAVKLVFKKVMVGRNAFRWELCQY